MSEQERIAKHILANDGFGALVEHTHYRANGPTRTMVHMVVRSWSFRVRTSIEQVGNKYLLWYKVIER